MEKNIKEILTDTNPPQNPILQVCYVEGGLVKTGDKWKPEKRDVTQT